MLFVGSSSHDEVGQTMADRSKVIHSRKQYADPETGAHVNTAEAFISQIIRAQIGVYHNLGRKHFQRYLNEILWRWNHRTPVAEKTVVKYSKVCGGCSPVAFRLPYVHREQRSPM